MESVKERWLKWNWSLYWYMVNFALEDDMFTYQDCVVG